MSTVEHDDVPFEFALPGPVFTAPVATRDGANDHAFMLAANGTVTVEIE